MALRTWLAWALGLFLAGLTYALPPAAQSTTGFSLRFYGHGTADIDRVKIAIDPPTPADVGGDFTLEFWLRANPAENTGVAACNTNSGWVTGNIVIDRDTFGSADYGDFGVSLTGGRPAFGVSRGTAGNTVCSSVSVADGQWHHVALTRQADPGQLRIFVDGVQVGQGSGPTGDVSYRDGRGGQPNDPYLVLGAEKHDISSQYPSFRGWLDELRISTGVRYTADFTRPAAPFAADANTIALYHFDEGPAGACTGSVSDALGLSPGVCRYGGAEPAGPLYTTDTPPFVAPSTSTPSATATFTATGTASATPTDTPTPAPTATGTPTPSATATFTATGTASAAPTDTPTGTSTPTATPEPASPTDTPTPTLSPIPATPTTTTVPAASPTAPSTATGTRLPLQTATATHLVPATGGRLLYLPLLLNGQARPAGLDRSQANGQSVYLPVILNAAGFTPPPAGGFSLRFYGHGVDAPDLDRVKIALDAPARPVDVSGDFTLEFWIKAEPGANASGAAQCDANDGWIYGNIVVDRDIFGGGDYGDYGISLSGGRVVFGASVGGAGNTICGGAVVTDGAWHHVAVTRQAGTGQLRVFVDGQLDAQGSGPAGDISYRDNRAAGSAADPYLVIAAEKHDAGAAYPSFSGWVDELRVSNIVRYTASFTPPAAPFAPDANAVGLYHFDEGPAGACTGAVLDSSGAAGGPSNGVCQFGGSAPAGPVYSLDRPFP